MVLFVAAVLIGLVLLLWSADKFVDGASGVAKHYDVSPLVIGMVIIGFGTSAPEIVVSAISAFEGNPGIALGNAFGSNIANIALTLGATALLVPIFISSEVLRKELPILAAVTVVTAGLLYDLHLSRWDAAILLALFFIIMGKTIFLGFRNKNDSSINVAEADLEIPSLPIKTSFFFLFTGLILLIISSRMLVYGAVGISTHLGISDVIIGLTVVAIGTSLPELASSYAAAKKNEAEMALGNILGSNLFNTLAVIGIAGAISPLNLDQEVFYRDVGLMTALTFSIFLFGFGRKGLPRIGRFSGGLLLSIFVAYTSYLVIISLN